MSSIGTACRPADNPFASHRVESLPFRQASLSPQNLVRRLDDLGGRAAVVGPEGSGKTTLLEELAHILSAESVMVRLPGSCRRPWRTTRAQLPSPVTPKHAVLIDGAEQLGRFGWFRLMHATRSAGYFIATLHRPGMLPTLIECRTDEMLLRELVGELAPRQVKILEPRLDLLYQRHKGNLRLCFRELYDLCAGRTTVEL